MDSQILISTKTSQSTKLKGLEKLLPPKGGISVASVGGQPQSVPGFAIVDGERLLQQDHDEQEILSTALEKKTPIVLENANKDITSALTGTGVDHDVVVLKPEGNLFTLALVGTSRSSSVSVQSMAKSEGSGEEDVKVSGGGSAESVVLDNIVSADEQDIDIEERVGNILLSSSASALSVGTMDAGDSKRDEWHYPYKFSLPQKDHVMTSSGKEQVFSIMMSVRYDLYAATDPANKYLVIQLLGAGFSAGNMIEDFDYSRSCIQNLMTVSIWPEYKYDGMVIEELNPKNQNRDGSWTVSSGIEVGGGLNIGKDPGLNISVSYNRTTSATQNLQEFEIINRSNQLSANFDYRLVSMEGAPVYFNADMDGEIDKSNPAKWRIRNVPTLAKTLLSPRCEVIWRFPLDFDQKVAMRINLNQQIRQIYHGADNAWHSKTLAINSLDEPFEVDLGMVKIPAEKEKSIPKFAARVLVEYKPEKDEVFTLRSLGDGTFEILESSTVQIPPKPVEPVKYMAYHVVKPGDMLSAISLRYYGSAIRDNWMEIYKANKDIMGSSYNNLRPGMVLKIPFPSLG